MNVNDLMGNAQEQSNYPSSLLVGEIVAINCETAEHDRQIDTKIGKSAATVAEVITAAPFGDGTYTNCGRIILWWDVVRRQVAHHNRPWLVGTISTVGEGRAYQVVPLGEDDLPVIAAALELHLSNPDPVANVDNGDE